MRTKGFVVAMAGVLLTTIIIGCRNEVEQKTKHAILASRITFQPNHGEPIDLTKSQAEQVRRIIQLFSDPSMVRVESEMLGFKYGDFILGENRFSWQGEMLYFRDENMKWHVVESAILGKLTEAYMQALGQPPLQPLSAEQWKGILSLLQNG